jgi:hypothetical protein
MTSTQQPAVDLYVRADAPIADRRESVVERLERLDRVDRIASYTVHQWPRAVTLDLGAATDDSGVLEAARAFEHWATRHGVRTRPPFEVHSTRSRITGETDRHLVVPTLCLAVYDEGTLVVVAPCRDDETAITVDDTLDALESGARLGPPSAPQREPSEADVD